MSRRECLTYARGFYRGRISSDGQPGKTVILHDGVPIARGWDWSSAYACLRILLLDWDTALAMDAERAA